ncbi:MAG: acyl-ACP--UDP-N-acetylglucosamine O-acyltransferase [Candidatus Omnitrophica bacterium]|nr:acyl-ACP--UDP-N-acetylglucosamine O-acyltransferase [Candidatus Omnitrophota bacterium]MDD5027502.1 acyl-ACP--UDP-N-acetylglucosamine O-acyltransferase [Candidatus Omnitrophota bacterium]MDD5662303.1 acyl-ACP--UDP-N-acetylglucosamine O-acyltransferase [Candidatus Omnitrophota bacterium]
MPVDKTAIVSENARIGENVSIGPYAVISGEAVIGAGTKIASHCVIEGNTTIGRNCEIFTGAVIGSRPQDLKYKGEKVYLEVGDNNIIREYCTLNPGTEEGSKTVVGDGNLIMAYSHVAHDCRVGNNCVLANGSTLAGHVTIEDRAVIGGLVAIHQFVRVGMLSIIGGCSKVVQDIPPYSTCDGHPAAVFGLNLVGLRRHNVSRESIGKLSDAFRILFSSGLSVKHALEKLVKEIKLTPEVTYLVEFIKKTERGLARSCRK